jgi:sugar lactone lactonase YvrE
VGADLGGAVTPPAGAARPPARSRRARLAVIVALSAALPMLYLGAWPVPIDPVPWDAPPAPAAIGPWAPNDALAAVERLELPPGDHGPEDVHVWRGALVGATASGRIVRWPAGGGPAEVIADTGGRPLGLHVDGDDRLLIADAQRGLLALSPDGALHTLCDRATDGSKLVFTDDLDVAPDGTIWFSDASTRFGQADWKLDLLESRPNGRLLRLSPGGPGCEVVLAGLHFANGVAVAVDGSFVLVNETSRYRVTRLWLEGPRAGQREVFLDDLPGFPDGISRGDGVFWVAIASPRNPVVDATSGWPSLRRAIVRLPSSLQPAPARHPYVVAVGADGRVRGTLQDPQGRSYGMVTSVEQHGEWLYLGSLAEPAAARVPVPPWAR